MTATISANGFIEIPSVFRDTDAIKEGQQYDIERLGKGEYRLRVMNESDDKAGQSWMDVLLACPVKGWYEPAERGETTDDFAPIGFE